MAGGLSVTPFAHARGTDDEGRIRRLEDALARLTRELREWTPEEGRDGKDGKDGGPRAGTVTVVGDGEVDEADIVWDAGAGHNHDGTDDGGRQVSHGDLLDVTADQHHAQVHSLTGADHTVSGLSTGDVLTATGATTFGFGKPGWTLLSVWGKLDISGLGTSYGLMNMPNHGGGGVDVLLRQPRAGRVMAVSVALDADVAGGGSYDVEVYAGPAGSMSGTGVDVSIPTGSRRAYDTSAAGVAFSAGDIVAPYQKRDGTISNTPTSICWVWVRYDP